MRRLGLMIGVALPLLMLVVSSFTRPDGASATSRPSPPTGVQATSVAGSPGVTVSWSAPASDGGFPILYYVASTYNGKHACISYNPGPNTCRINDITNGSLRHNIRVRAVNSSGAGQAVAVVSVVTSPSAGAPPAAPSTPASPATQGTAGDQTTGAASGGGDISSAVPTAASSNSGSGQLPFTGVNLATILLLGLTLVLIGQDLVRPLRPRRDRLRETIALGPVAVASGGLTRLSRWLFGL